MRYPLKNLINIRATQDWTWHGAVHEYIHLQENARETKHKFVVLDDVYIQVNVGEGARSQMVTAETKYLRDARLLQDELTRDPNDSRSMYYLGQSYRDAGHYDKALQAFRDRVAMGGWDQETFYAQYQVGRMAQLLDMDAAVVLAEHLAAWEFRPSRIEPLYELNVYFRTRGDHAKAFLFGMTAFNMTVPDDTLFNHYELYFWKIKDELCTVAYYAKRFDEGEWACRELLRLVESGQVVLPADKVERFRTNLGFYVQG